jgi:hypothetical protein
MSNVIYIDNCCTCACAHRIEQIAITRPGQDVIDYMNCYAVSGGACGTMPFSNETTLRNAIDTIWAELMAIDFDAPPIPFSAPNACSDYIYRNFGYDSGSGGYVETWNDSLTNGGLPYTQTVLDSGSPITGGSEVPVGGVGNGPFFVAGPGWTGNAITVVRTRIHYTGSLCLSTRECDSGAIGFCGLTGEPPITSIIACGPISDTGGKIYITHDPAFDPQDIVFTLNGTTPGYQDSSFFEIMWFGTYIDVSGNPQWHEVTPCGDCTCP